MVPNLGAHSYLTYSDIGSALDWTESDWEDERRELPPEIKVLSYAMNVSST